MKKYECVQRLFSQLLSYPYRPLSIQLHKSWWLQATPGTAKIDPAKPYIGLVPIEVEFYCGEEKKLTWQLTMRCLQTSAYPSLEDEKGGYAFLIRSSKSELLFRAMQAAKYVQDGEKMKVTISTDLNSKRGDTEFRTKMLNALNYYATEFEAFGSKKLESNQFAFIDYDSVNDTLVQDGQMLLSSALLLAMIKAILKGELSLPLEIIDCPSETLRKPTVWKVAPGSQAAYWSEALAQSKIFIGWPELGNLKKYTTKIQLREAYDLAYNPEQEPIKNMDSIWSFCQEMKPGDIVIANKGWKELTGIGRIMGEYEYESKQGDEYHHFRSVEWVVISSVQFTGNVFSTPTVTRVPQKHMAEIRKMVVSQVDDGEKLWNDLFGTASESDAISTVTKSLIEDFQNYLQAHRLMYSREFVGRFITSLQSKPFLILSGGSGTGKTKIAQHFADYMNDNAELETPQNIPFEDRGKSFLLQLYPYMFNYQRMIVTVEMLEWATIDDLEQGVEIKVRFGDQEEKSLMKKQGNSVRLGFRKKFMAWLSSECRIGDSLLLTIEEEGRVFAFSKETEEMQQADDNLAFISVRPDWLNNRSLMGYYNPLTEQYEPTTLLKLMLRAEQNPSKPYFVILDEMNLAKVEYYFSDFLSCLESRRCDEAGYLKQEAIELHQVAQPLEHVDAFNRVYVIPPKMHIPINVYLIGTVNIDETTYMFSPKVLDRANVLECNEVDLQNYWNSGDGSSISSSSYNSVIDRSSMFTNKENYHLSLYRKEFLNADHKPMLQEAFEVISKLQELLKEEGRPFGYRVLDEIMTYLIMAQQYNIANLDSAIDAQIVQKILPKLHGNRKELELLLRRLLGQFTISELQGDLLSSDTKEVLAMEESYRFPLSGKKVFAMYKQLLQTGYCSFIC